MISDSGRNESIWKAEGLAGPYPPLPGQLRVDVCVIGAGIAGLSTAYHLGREGKYVVVVDDGPLGGGETGRTTAHLSNVLDDRFTSIEKMHGPRGASLAAASHGAAIDAIEETVAREGIGCDFERVDGFLMLAPGVDVADLERELEAARRAGLDGRLVARAPLPGRDTGPAILFPGQAQFDPLRYLQGLAHAIVESGGLIAAGDPWSHVESIERGRPARVVTAGGATIVADSVIVATNSPVHLTFAIHAKQAAYRSYVLGLPVPKGDVQRALYWDMADPYHYVRLHGEGDREILIVGGEDEKTGQETDPEAAFLRLEAWARERVPSAGPPEYRWSGQVMEPIDGLAFIGPDEPDSNIYVVTGDSGMGMTHGTIAGLLLADLIAGRSNPWATLYDPSRRALAGAGEFLRENLDVAAQYLDWVTGGDVGSVDEIEPGTGAVIRRGLRKLAVYRDPGGALHVLSAVCSHLGCIVAWNVEERTWDCPCHGSRFAPEGRVVNGPATTALAGDHLGEGSEKRSA